jgi:hypothetical protein
VGLACCARAADANAGPGSAAGRHA